MKGELNLKILHSTQDITVDQAIDYNNTQNSGSVKAMFVGTKNINHLISVLTT